MTTKTSFWYRCRSAITGRFVKPAQALAAKWTTVRTRLRHKR